MTKWLYRFALGLLVLVVVVRGLDWLARRGSSLPALPQPNGYVELLSCAGRLKLPATPLEELGQAEIKAAAGDNAATLEQAHQALRGACGVTLNTKRGWSEKHEGEIKALKRLAVALGIRARAMQLDGRTNDTAQSHVDMVLLGQAMAKGGLIMDGINGLVVETFGAGSLRGDLPNLDAAACRAAARELERAEARREPVATILETERRWAASNYGLWSSLLFRSAAAKSRANFENRSNQTIQRTRRVLLAIAVRAFELEHGQRPRQASELVPAYLAAVPQDPVKGAPFTDLPKTGMD